MAQQWIWWEVTYDESDYFKVRRMVKRGTLWARCELEYGNLTHYEVTDVLDMEMETALLGKLLEDF